MIFCHDDFYFCKKNNCVECCDEQPQSQKFSLETFERTLVNLSDKTSKNLAKSARIARFLRATSVS